MGFTTNITISNDFFDQLLRDPRGFVEDIQIGMNDTFEENSNARASRHYVQVHNAQHADTAQVIYSHANVAYPIHEMPYVIARGGTNKYQRQALRNAVNKIRWYTDQLEAELDAHEATEVQGLPDER